MTTDHVGRIPRLSRLVGRIVTVAIATAFVAWLVLLRPTALGGSTTYVVVSGDSMLPVYEPGDLVIAQASETYASGAIVVYRIPVGEPGAGRLIIHRIVAAGAGGGYTTRGDHNSYTDPWRPTQADIVGKPAGALPGFGPTIAHARSPMVAGLFAGLATLIWLWPYRRKPNADDDAPARGEIPVARPNPA